MDAMRKRYVTVSDFSSCTPWPLTLWNGRQFTPKVPVSRWPIAVVSERVWDVCCSICFPRFLAMGLIPEAS
jgi:hypothetical protein